MNKINYVSILADGAGALSAAGALVPSTGLPVNRIDFIPGAFDKVDRYSFFDFSNISTPEAESLKNIPSYILYKLFLETNATENLEFNYIVNSDANFNPIKPGSNDGAKQFFDLLGKEAEFTKNFKQSGPGAEKKFDFWVNDDSNNSTSISCYVGGKNKVDYAFSMINKISAPNKSDTVSKIGLDYVPNHAQNISAKSKSAALGVYNIKIKQHKEETSSFEKLLGSIAAGGLNSICKSPQNKVYCSELNSKSFILKFGENSLFQRRYDEYLYAKTEISKLEQLKEGHVILIEVGKDKELIDSRLGEYKTLLESSNANFESIKNKLSELQIFKPGLFLPGKSNNTMEAIATSSDILGRRAGIEYMIKKLKDKQKTASTKCSIPDKCKTTPIPLRAFKDLNSE